MEKESRPQKKKKKGAIQPTPLQKDSKMSNFAQSQEDECNDLLRSSWDLEFATGVSPFLIWESSLVFFCSKIGSASS